MKNNNYVQFLCEISAEIIMQSLTDEKDIASIIKIIDNLSDAVWLIDKHSNQVFLGKGFERIWGRPISFLSSSPDAWHSAIHPDDKKFMADVHYRREVSDAGGVGCYEVFRIIRPDGSIRKIRDISFSLRDSQSQVIANLGIATDITDIESLPLEQGARIAERNYHYGQLPTREQQVSDYFIRFVEKSRDFFWIRDSEYEKHLYLSPVFEALVGVTTQSIYDNPSSWVKLLHPEDRARIKNSAKKRIHYLKDKAGYRETYRLVCPDEKILWFVEHSFPLFDRDKRLTGYVGIAQDITEIQEKNRSLAKERERADAANKAKSTFLAMISHELRTPLNGILGISEILASQVTDPNHINLVHDLKYSTDHLLSIVNDLLDISKLESGTIALKSTVIHLRKLVENVIAGPQVQAQAKGLKFFCQIGKDLPEYVVGDHVRIRQVLLNLLSNAIKFTAEGEVSISVELSAKLDSRTSQVKFSVSDTGIGIDEALQSEIFKSFYQVSSAAQHFVQGTGLGLSICKELVDLMEGDIDVESQLNSGSVFTFTLPFQVSVNPNLPQMFTAEEHAEKTFQLSHLRLLLVEDNKINQKVILGLLAPLGCAIHVVEKGQEAVDYVKENPCDMILMDCGLEDMTGVMATQKIRSLRLPCSNIIVIAVTAHAFESDKMQCLEGGMDDYLSKPIDKHQLHALIYSWHQKIIERQTSPES